MKSMLAFFFHLINLKRRGFKEASCLVIESNFIKEVTEGVQASTAALRTVTGCEGECCSVCLSGLREGGETRKLLCSHVFHKACVDHWLNFFHRTCPLCRFLVESEPSYKKDELMDEMVVWFSSFHVAGF